MPEINQQEEKLQEKKSFFELMIEIMGWLQIVASPFALGLFVGTTVFFAYLTYTSFIIGILITFLGLIIGIIWATRIWKRKGTMNFLSRTMATPELEQIPIKTHKKKDPC